VPSFPALQEFDVTIVFKIKRELWHITVTVFFLIIATWYTSTFYDPFLSALSSSLLAGGFGAIIPARITSLIHIKYLVKWETERRERSLKNMNVDAIRRYVNAFDDYQSKLMEYKEYKENKAGKE
jgi:hypothetical protein